MDVVLGVAVTGPVARLALVGSGAAGQNVIDQSVVDIAGHPVEALTETVVGTNRLLADESHRLVATRVCWTDRLEADRLRRALEDSGVHNVGVLTESQAAAALMRAAGRPGAVLVMDDETATLSIVGAGAEDESNPPTMLASGPVGDADASGTFDTVMARLGEQPDAPRDLYLVGASSELTQMAEQLRDASTMRVEVADDPTFALARGAALTAAPLAGGPDATMMAPAVGLGGDATAMAPAVAGDQTAIAPTSEFADPNADGQQLAYSMAGDDELLPAGMDDYDDYDVYDDYVDSEAETGPLRLSRRSLVVGNAVIAFAVVAFASLAVAVAVAVRPTAASQPVIGHQNAAPGKFMPLLPTQQQAPVPAPPVDAPNAGYQGGIIPDSNGYIPPQVTAPVGGTAPIAPVPAPAPGVVPIPMPIPVPIPYPGWQPNQPPYYPPTTTPYTPPTTTTTPPTTTPPTTTPPTTTPPTTTPPTTTPPTTTPYTTLTTTSEPPTTSSAPPTTQTTQPPTTSNPPPTTQPSVAPSTKPQTQAPATTQAPAPTYTQTQQPVTPKPATPATPQAPHGGGTPHH